ncbi:MAG: response regulator [Pseudomonadales bacterium]
MGTVFLAQQENIALIVCDVVMPNMGGRQLLRLVREVDDSIPFVFTSGYVGGPDPKNFAERYDVEFLQKPFSAASLQQLVRTTLDSRSQRLSHQRLVLVVDDNASILHLLELDIKELGHSIETATSGAEAIELCKRNEFDLIFMDIQMQPMDGHQATRIIRGNADTTARIFGLTAHYTEEEKKACLAAGMDDVITKPIHFDRLANLVGGKHHEDGTKPESKPIPVFDLDVSLHLANNRTDVAEEMFKILMNKLPEDQQLINDAFTADDMDAFGQQVHKLNGAVRYCGVPALSEAINRLETLTKNCELDDIESCLNDVNNSIDELQAWRDSNPNPFQIHRMENGLSG